MVKFRVRNQNSGFTLIELLAVISMIGLLASIILVSLNSARDKARVAAAASTQRQLQKAAELYLDDVGFYPPDVTRGWDPGLSRALPYNSDLGQDCAIACSVICDHCPANWMTVVVANWKGPYVSSWPNTTPWKGEYDYNYWAVATDRYGCLVPAGIYVGVQGDYDNNNIIPSISEQQMLNIQLDHDGCLNGEAQMLLIGL